MGFDSDLPLDERHLAFDKLLSLPAVFGRLRREILLGPCLSRIQVIVFYPQHYAAADNLTADTFHDKYEVQVKVEYIFSKALLIHCSLLLSQFICQTLRFSYKN